MEVILPLAQMTLAEKLRLMEVLWDDLSRQSSATEPPAWHMEILRERRRRVEAGEAVYNDWEDVKARLFRQRP